MSAAEVMERTWLRVVVPFVVIGALVGFLIHGWSALMIGTAYMGAIIAIVPAVVAGFLRGNDW
jgi:ABC-type transport system involved in cytochrome bd biosynthesis fused ATPase/permease subunit